ncbi:hypothetical protein [Streptomyces erythrochromogenes]|uniref:hypothetical protein n=1 Tax=Streptomyces erythrochromogenes TaxID=285574 RepID=UPI003815103C
MHESSVGGPLLWPAGEPWASCSQEHDAPFGLTTPEEVRTLRRIRALGVWTDEDHAEVSRINAGHDPSLLPEGPHPLVPVAQLYARDVPDLPFPEGTDLLQVLWCPFIDIVDQSGSEAVQLHWRRAADVAEAEGLAAAPEPAYVGTYELVLVPCVLHPEQVLEYPAAHDLDPGSAGRSAGGTRTGAAHPRPQRVESRDRELATGRGGAGRVLDPHGCHRGPRLHPAGLRVPRRSPAPAGHRHAVTW